MFLALTLVTKTARSPKVSVGSQATHERPGGAQLFPWSGCLTPPVVYGETPNLDPLAQATKPSLTVAKAGPLASPIGYSATCPALQTTKPRV